MCATTSGQPLEDKPRREGDRRASSKLGEGGRLVIRPSGTEPVIRVMAEGDDERLVSTVVGDIVRSRESRSAGGIELYRSSTI